MSFAGMGLRVGLCGLLIFSFGCGLQVNSLREEMPRVAPVPEAPPISLRVEELGRGEDDASRRVPFVERGLVDALRETRLFSAVQGPGKAGETDLVMRGQLQSKWGSGGFLNFLTYFPGGLVFAPSWRGTRWRFTSSVDLELVEAASGEVVGRYAEESAHEFVHRSGNPMHFFGAALVIPGTITGSTKGWIRSNQRKAVYDKAYPDLWNRVAIAVVADREPAVRAELEGRRARCGVTYGADPVVGANWEEFRVCQPIYFRKMGERQTSAGAAWVYEDISGRLKVYVVEGRISQWDGAAAP